MSPEPLFSVRDAAYRFPSGAVIFEDFSWQISRGEAWSVLGPSGCGKTTLLYLLAGLLEPDRGEVVVEGRVISRPRPRTGLIIQEYGLLPWATVRENVRLGLDIRGFYGPDGTHAPRQMIATGEVDPWLERLEILDQADKFPAQLSGGQRQRTAVARTLVLRPDTLLMDEPFSSLDAPTREALQVLTLELQRERELTTVLVTHNIEEAAVMGGKILLLDTPPNREAVVVDNPGGARPGFRGTNAYYRMCDRLREMLGGGAGAAAEETAGEEA